ncbi:retrovirus-related pol polyprotein from transposon TNT 1-94 [Tanacetum coccineum]|uniref:Retrovirus-related pol polyprotein from transposon TNT 1-94 n=1 Tax=Tanacetum coccineum TaxID=301880 RepID=A0ABQ5H109_9ASTR
MPKSSLQFVDEVVDECVLEKEPAYNNEEANLQRALELSLKEHGEQTQGTTRLVVIREPDSRRIQPLPEVQGKGKEKVAEEQAAHDLLTLQTPKPKNPAYQFIFQRHTPMPTEPSEHADTPSLDAELALTDSETKSEEEVHVFKVGDQDEGHTGPNLGEQDEGQAGSNAVDAAESQPQPSHVVHASPNLKHVDLETTDALLQQKPEQMDEEFTITAYPNVQENLKLLTKDQFFMEKPQEEESRKTNAEAEVSKAVDEIVIDAVDWVMQALLRACFRDLPTVDIKEILQQRMFDDNTYKTHEVHNDLYEALQKSVDLDYLNQCLANQEEARNKKRKRRASGALGNQALSSSKIATSTLQSMAWTTSNTQYESANIPGAQELSPTDYLMLDDSIPEEQVLLSNDEDFENDHQPKADLRKD